MKDKQIMPGTEYFKRNNLDKSSSPYLLQHAGNPIWWQEWSRDALEQAVRDNQPVFVSVGYATCHWCHVMAAEAFSDTITASYLNDNYVCIKVDREQRPDIDQIMMHFIQAQSGSGRVLMTSINLGEVLYITERERGLPLAQRVLALVESLPITLLEADNALVFVNEDGTGEMISGGNFHGQPIAIAL